MHSSSIRFVKGAAIGAALLAAPLFAQSTRLLPTGSATLAFENIVPLDPDSSRSIVLFVANDLFGNELWRSDGTAAGTFRVMDINPFGDGITSTESWVVSAGRLYFRANDGINGNELWSSDGTAAGTQRLTNLIPGAVGGLDNTSGKFVADALGRIWFGADNGVSGNEPWLFVPATGAAVMVSDLRPGTQGSFPSFLTSTGGTVFFHGTDGVRGVELCVSNVASTRLVFDLMPGPQGGGALLGQIVGSDLYFRGFDGVNVGLYRTNPAAALAGQQPTLVTFNSTGLFDPSAFTNYQGALHCIATGSSGRGHYTVAAGTATGTYQSTGDWLIANGIALYRFDAGQLYVVGSPTPINTGGNAFPWGAAAAGLQGVFYADDTAGAGQQPFYADWNGATLLQTIGTSGSSPRAFTRIGTKVFFVADLGGVPGLHTMPLAASPDVLAESFSVGGPAPGGTPTLSLIPGTGPQLGNIILLQMLDGVGAPVPTWLATMGAPTLAIDINAGLNPQPCWFWVPSPIANINSSGSLVVLPVPNDPGLKGFELYAQGLAIINGAQCQVQNVAATDAIHFMVN